MSRFSGKYYSPAVSIMNAIRHLRYRFRSLRGSDLSLHSGEGEGTVRVLTGVGKGASDCSAGMARHASAGDTTCRRPLLACITYMSLTAADGLATLIVAPPIHHERSSSRSFGPPFRRTERPLQCASKSEPPRSVRPLVRGFPLWTPRGTNVARIAGGVTSSSRRNKSDARSSAPPARLGACRMERDLRGTR